MSSPIPKFYFPIAPTEYNQQFMNEVIRTFALFQEQLGNPGKVTAESINLKPAGAEGIKQYSNNREAYDDGLIPGDLWMLSTGEIRVVISPDIDVPVTMPHPQEASGFVGRVTTFDASAEIGDIVNVIEGQVGSVSIEFGYLTTGLEGVSSVGSPSFSGVTGGDFTGFPSGLSGQSNIGTVTVAIS